MTRRFVYFSTLFFSLLLLFATPAHAQQEQYEGKSVAKVDVHVNKLSPDLHFDTQALVSRLKTKVGDPFSQVTFDTDLKLLAEEYDRIEPSIEVVNNALFITLN